MTAPRPIRTSFINSALAPALASALAAALVLIANPSARADTAKPRLFAAPETARSVTEKVDILELARKGEVEYSINFKADPEANDPPEKVFVPQANGDLLITGKAWGYMSTKEAFKDYHLVLEFKWTGPTWGKRTERTRDSGLLIHSHGSHGALGGTFCASIEAQIIEGGMGDILVLSPKMPDGTVYQSSLESEFELDRDGEKRWKKGAPRQEVKSGRINWEKRDEDWVDKIGFRGKDDPDKAVGEWNTLEVIAKGDTLQYLFNGQLVNEAFKVSPSAGPIGIQTEAAGLRVRRFELLPLKD